MWTGAYEEEVPTNLDQVPNICRQINKGSSWTHLTTYCTDQKESWVAKNYNKDPAALHFTAHYNKQINNCEWITRKAWEIQAILKLTHTQTHTHTHTHNVRYTVLLIIMGVETPWWKKHQGLSDGLNCIGTVGWVSVHVNPCHVITSLSAANSVEATTCVAVQLRRNTTDPRNVYYGRSPPFLKQITLFLLSGCWYISINVT